MIERATDATLLMRFSEGREEAAFSELVERHGPLVRRVCRRYLRSEHDVEDVSQATFLLLALRASDVAWRSSIGGWVRDVARRLAMNARGELARRGRRETPVSNLSPSSRFGDAGALPDPECPLPVFTEEVERREVRRAIDGAVGDLPEKYRDPLVLCYLEGMTNHEAAAALGYPAGSISRRLDRARSLLRKGLVGRGVTLALAAALAAWLVWDHRDGGIPSRPEAASPGRLADGPQPETVELRELMTALERNDGEGLDADSLGRATEHAARAARFSPGRERIRGLADETEATASELARKAGDPSAATRLLATCVRCHVALR